MSVPLPLPTSAVVVVLVQMGAATESKTSEEKAMEAARIGGFVTSTEEQSGGFGLVLLLLYVKTYTSISLNGGGRWW